jgi:hypothetical protein
MWPTIEAQPDRSCERTPLRSSPTPSSPFPALFEAMQRTTLLPRSTPSITETFNRLSNPFSEQSGLWLWDAEIPPDAHVSRERTAHETVRDRTADEAQEPPAQTWAGLGATTYEPFGDPMQGWAWPPPLDANSADAGFPPLVGARPAADAWQQPVQLDEPTESWHSFTDPSKSDVFATNIYQTPPDAPRFNAAMHAVDTAYDSDSSNHSEVWSAASSSDDEHSRTPDMQMQKPQCKPCTTARKSPATSAKATRPSSRSTEQPESMEPAVPCPFCTENGEDDELVSDGRKTRKRRRKAVSRTTQRHGRWWQTLGYDGPAYCQRCSEVFRDHIIRQKPNSAECNRNNPCHECAKVLAHFSSGTGNHTQLWDAIDARGYAKVRRRTAAKAPRGSNSQSVMSVPVTA